MNLVSAVKMVSLAAIISVCLVAPQYVFGQSAKELGLVLTGNKITANQIELGGQKLVRYELRMTFENKGSEPVIVINPTLGYGSGLKDVTFSIKDRRSGKYDHPKKTFEIDKEKLENFRSMAEFFESDRPSENMTKILEVGETFSFVENFDAEVKYGKQSVPAEFRTYKTASGETKKLLIYSTYTDRAEFFQLSYEFSFLLYVADPDLLEKMAQRWRRYGRLPVGINGTYTITSEPIK